MTFMFAFVKNIDRVWKTTFNLRVNIGHALMGEDMRDVIDYEVGGVIRHRPTASLCFIIFTQKRKQIVSI